MVLNFLFGKKEQKPVQPIMEHVDPRVKMGEVSIKLRILVDKLQRSYDALVNKRDQLFERVVRAEAEKDRERAAVYASEIVQVKKIAKTILVAITTLEKVVLRLDTVKEAIEAKEILSSPELGVLRPLTEQLRGVMPEVSLELGKINENLEEAMMSFGTIDSYNYVPEVRDQDVQSILKEASEVAVQRMKTSFPELPNAARETERSQSIW
ncbi:MAG TPA: Snf7 family protein [Thermoproteota archaeon]|nr:Snf7 family protein [Thermoproteota archaeon]